MGYMKLPAFTAGPESRYRLLGSCRYSAGLFGYMHADALPGTSQDQVPGRSEDQTAGSENLLPRGLSHQPSLDYKLYLGYGRVHEAKYRGTRIRIPVEAECIRGAGLGQVWPRLPGSSRAAVVCSGCIKVESGAFQ